MSEPEAIFARCRGAPRRGRRRSPGGASSSPPAARASRSTRCATSATAPAGRMGVALAAEAARRGAEVTLVAANVAVPAPAGSRSSRRRPPPTSPARLLARADADVDRHGRGGRRLPAGRSGSDGKRPKDDATLDDRRSSRPQDVLAELGRRRRPRPGARRLRRRRGRARARARAREARQQAREPLRLQRRISFRHRLRLGGQRGGPDRARTASARSSKRSKEECAVAILDEVATLLRGG